MSGLNGIVLALCQIFVLVTVSKANVYSVPPTFGENKGLDQGLVLNSGPQGRADDLDYRLPNNTEPLSYNVTLTTNIHTGERAFTGVVSIDLIATEDTRTIVLHARQLSDFEATIISKDVTNAVPQTLTSTYEAEREFLTLTPTLESFTLTRNSNYTLTINYTGALRLDNGGFYQSTYNDQNGRTRYLATTQFESTNARHGFPCYDEPSKRANFTIIINHDPSYHALSNLPVDEEASSAGKTVFKTSVKMPTYLVAFIVSDFEWSEGSLYSLPQRVYSRPGTERDQEWGLVSGMLIVQRLGEFFGVDFALPKLDQVAVPDFAAGAMENWGLVTYREEYLLYNVENSTVNTQTNVANIIGHEYVHQWFGNLVAIKWWTYLWLKEGFAQLYSYQGTNDAYPEWGIFQLFHVSDYQSALNNDAGQNSRPMSHYVQTPSEISSLYDTVSYAKAASVIRMWQHALTTKVFQRGLNNYLEINKYTAADEWQLFSAIANAAVEENYPVPATIPNMFSSWTQQGGYPLLTVKRDYTTGSFVVTQSAFYNNETIEQPKSWYIPFNFAVQSNPDFRDTEANYYLLDVASTTVAANISSDDWLILNKQSTGYYRINYDERNWLLITQGLKEKSYKIHPHNRAQLMHDAYRFSSSNRLSHDILLNLLTYLETEDQYAPWTTANSIFTTYNRYLSGDDKYKDFQLFLADLVNPIYDKLGVNDIPGEQHFQKLTRAVAINLACTAGIESCLKETNDKLKGLIENNIRIEPNLQSQTYCNGLKQSGDNEFNFVFDKLMNSDDQAQRRILISALGCSQNANHLQKFVSSSIELTNELRTQERTTLLSSAYSRGETGLLACIDFLNENWEAYASLTASFGGSNPLDVDIRGMSQYVVNDNQEKQLLALVEKVKNSQYVSQTLETSVQNNINANYAWLKINRDPLINWIQNYRSPDGSATISASLFSIIIGLVVVFTRLI